MKRFLAIATLMALASCGGSDKPANEPAKDQPLAQSKNSAGFNSAFGNLLTNYYHLKDALVLSNDVMAATSAKLVSVSAESIKPDELKADSGIVETAQGYLKSIDTEAKALANKTDIEAKRKSFQTISDNMYDLVRTVHYDRAVVYHEFCPMAFNDAGAYWLNNSSDVKNPYLGKKMLTCGEVKDSVDFRGK